MNDEENYSDVSVVIPAKDEAGAIGELLSDIKYHLPGAGIFVVNDGSNDETPAIAEACGAEVVNHRYAIGNGAAIKNGARAAKGDIILFMDADGQHDPGDAPRLIEKLRSGYDMVVGARQRGSQASLGRGMANGFYNKLASYITGQPVEDLTSGYRAVRADKFREFLYLLPNGFSYPATSTMAFFRSAYPVAYEPIHAATRVGKSHLRPLKDGVRFLIIIFKVGTLYSPLKLFAPLALLFFLLGMSWYGYTYFAMNRFTNMSALLITGSFIVFMMGLISEQITALMYKEE